MPPVFFRPQLCCEGLTDKDNDYNMGTGIFKNGKEGVPDTG